MKSEKVRIQLDIPIGKYKELFERYIPNDKFRHKGFYDATVEFCKRRAGRDKKFRKEQLLSDMALLRPIIQELIDKGYLHIK